jgi:LytS/YehU family sensor histidine kinase
LDWKFTKTGTTSTGSCQDCYRLTYFHKTEILYIETGWELLSVRRKRRKLQLCYNIVNKNTPNYRCTLIPPTIQSTSVYPLRNENDIILPFFRLSSTKDSFIPSTIKMWNSLNNAIRNVDTLSSFKSELKKIDKTANHAVPKHYFYGN